MKIQIAERLQAVPAYYFAQKLEYVQQMRNQGLDVISLGLGSPDLPPPPEAIQAAIAAFHNPGIHGYPTYRGSLELRTALAQWYQATYEVTLNPAQEILPLLGSKEGILYLSLALLNPGDSVLVPNPGYPSYSSVARLLGVNVLYYDLTDDNGWLPDLTVIENQDLSCCKLMWVNYPHMPTGQAGHLALFEQLVEFGHKHQIFICNDNPYGLVLNETPPLSIFAADPHQEVVAELNSLSKSFHMAGWRVGMISGSAELIDAVLRVKSNADSGMFLAVQHAAIAALGIHPHWHQERNQVYAQRRTLVRQIFDALGFTYRCDQVGLFVWAKAPDSLAVVADYLDQLLEKAHIFLTPGQIFGSNGSRYARASLCAPVERLQQALERLKGFSP